MSTADAAEEGITVRQRLFVFAAMLIVAFIAVLVLAYVIG